MRSITLYNNNSELLVNKLLCCITILEMVKYFQKETFASPVVVEIGTLWGGLSNSILRAIPTAHWFAIDPLYPSYDIMDEASDLLQFLANDLNLSAPDLSWALSLALTHNQVTNYGCHYHLLWTNSLDASRKFADGSVDVIFVDGEASYAATAADISAWFPKLRKPGGRFIFSNYGNAAFMGVTFAIDDFLRTHPTYNVTFASANSLRITVKLEDDVQVVDRHCAQYTLSTPPGVGPGIINANCRDFEAKIKPNKLSIMSQVDLIHVVSAGGSGTTAIINHLRAKGLKTNHPHDFDALKHRPFNGVCPYKGLYIYGDSIKVVQSLYRRGYQRQMSLKLSGFTRSVPATAEAYLGQHEDLHFRLKEHMQGWLQCESVMAVTAQDIQNHPKVVADHLGLFLSNVTGFKVHNRTVTNTSGVSRYFQRLSSELTALAANPSKTDRTRKCIAQDIKDKSNSVRSWGLSNMIV